MNLFPELSVAAAFDDENLPVYTEWAYDFEKNEFLTSGGLYYKVEKNEALKIWIYKALKTQRYRYPAYPRNFGSEVEEVIGLSGDREIIESEIERYIQEALTVNPYIISVDDFEFEYGSKTSVMFTVSTIYGELNMGDEVDYG